MRPSTPAQALGLAEHRRLYPDHSGDGCCSFLEDDLVTGEELVSELEALGWLPPSPAVSLPESAPRGDPATAAALIDDVNDRQWACWYVLDFRGPMTAEEVWEAMTGGRWVVNLPPQSEASVRSRLVELERAGHVQRTANKRPTRNGGLAQVWAAKTTRKVAA